jgi:tetratricopeptide (TPR) repeat protein
MMKDSPIIGLGYNRFEADYMNYQSEYFRLNKGNVAEKHLAGNVVSAYNECIRIAVEHGIVGLGLFIVFIYVVLFCTKIRDTVSLAVKAVVVVYLIFSCFSFPNRIFSLQVVLVMSLALLLNRQKCTMYNLQYNTLLLASARFVVLLCALLLLIVTVRFHVAYQKYQSLLENSPKDIFKALKTLDRTISGDVLYLQNYCIIAKGKVENVILLGKLNEAIRLCPSNTLYRMKGDCLNWMKRYEEAEQSYWTAHYMIPSQQRARARLVLLYVSLNRLTEAKELAREILNERVKVYGLDTHLLHQEMKGVIFSLKKYNK